MRQIVMTPDEINNKVLRPILSMRKNDKPEPASWKTPIMTHAASGGMLLADISNKESEYCIIAPAPDILWANTRPKVINITFHQNFLKR
jgi:hypothetical protein